jgi:predicted site-specific integrase-resolvase
MKLSDYAKQQGVHYRTAWRWFHAGKLKGRQLDTGTILIDEDEDESKPYRVAVYARVSSSENKSNLDAQADRLVAYCAAKGWQVSRVVKEVDSGINDARPKLLELLEDENVTVIVVEHKDRLTRFGYNYIETLLKKQGRSVEIVNLAEDGREDLMQDLVAIIYSFSARMYGLRWAKRKTEKIIKELEDAVS